MTTQALGSPELGAGAGRTFLVRRREEWRQLGIVSLYVTLLIATPFVEALQNPLTLVVACYLSFLDAVVIHNHMHRGIFHSRTLNKLFRLVLSFGNLYPASANIPAHNLVHHHFGDDGQPDWADPHIVRFKWNLLNLLHFPNVAGTRTFDGVQRWAKVTEYPGYTRQYTTELALAFAATGALMFVDFWATLFFVVVPQLYGARCILRINLIQHDRTEEGSEFNHSRNFVGRAFNWVMCNNGYHTIHHNRAGLHWADLAEAHDAEVKPRIDPALDQPSMLGYLASTYLFAGGRPPERDLCELERASEETDLASRDLRRADALADAVREAAG